MNSRHLTFHCRTLALYNRLPPSEHLINKQYDVILLSIDCEGGHFSPWRPQGVAVVTRQPGSLIPVKNEKEERRRKEKRSNRNRINIRLVPVGKRRNYV